MDQTKLMGSRGTIVVRKRTHGRMIEAMEARRLLSVTTIGQLPNITVAEGTASSTVDLTTAFADTSQNAQVRYSATTDNTALVTPTVSGTTLTLKYATTTYGTAHVTATAAEQGAGASSASETFLVTITPQTNVTIGAGGASLIHFSINGDSTHHAGSGILYLAGGGTAVVHFTGNVLPQDVGTAVRVSGTGDIAGITITGSTAKTILAIATSNTRSIQLGAVTADGSMLRIVARNVTLVGNMTVGGGIGSMTVGAAVHDVVSFGSDATLAGQISINNISSATVNVNGPLKLLQTMALQSSAINVNGNLGTLNFKSAGGAGAISGLALTTSGTITSLNVRGGLVNSVIRSGGNIRAINAGSITGTQVYAGVGPLQTGQTLPLTGDLISIAEISRVVVKGAFSDSVIAADRIGSALLNDIPSDNGGTSFGLAATRISSVSGKVDGHPFRLSHLRTGNDTHSLLTAQGVTPGDFVINML